MDNRTINFSPSLQVDGPVQSEEEIDKWWILDPPVCTHLSFDISHLDPITIVRRRQEFRGRRKFQATDLIIVTD
jgi:hypothetical protein